MSSEYYCHNCGNYFTNQNDTSRPDTQSYLISCVRCESSFVEFSGQQIEEFLYNPRNSSSTISNDINNRTTITNNHISTATTTNINDNSNRNGPISVVNDDPMLSFTQQLESYTPSIIHDEGRILRGDHLENSYFVPHRNYVIRNNDIHQEYNIDEDGDEIPELVDANPIYSDMNFRHEYGIEYDIDEDGDVIPELVHANPTVISELYFLNDHTDINNITNMNRLETAGMTLAQYEQLLRHEQLQLLESIHSVNRNINNINNLNSNTNSANNNTTTSANTNTTATTASTTATTATTDSDHESSPSMPSLANPSSDSESDYDSFDSDSDTNNNTTTNTNNHTDNNSNTATTTTPHTATRRRYRRHNFSSNATNSIATYTIGDININHRRINTPNISIPNIVNYADRYESLNYADRYVPFSTLTSTTNPTSNTSRIRGSGTGIRARTSLADTFAANVTPITTARLTAPILEAPSMARSTPSLTRVVRMTVGAI